MSLPKCKMTADSSPLLSKGGVDATSNKNGAKPPLKERTGWLVQLPIVRWFERTTPSAPGKEASQHLISGAATPPSPRRGLALPETFGNTPGPGENNWLALSTIPF